MDVIARLAVSDPSPLLPTDLSPRSSLSPGEGAGEAADQGEVPGEVPAFDTEAAMERVDDDRELLAEILELFRAQALPLQNDIRRAVRERDTAALERSAHSLKGSAANISALEVQALALSLEETGRSGRWADAEAIQAEMDRAMPRLCAALDNFCAKNAS